MERGHVEVVLRLWCACVSGCGGEMLLVSAPHGGALWDRVWPDGQYVHGSEPSNSWFLSDAASGVMALALSAILVPVNGRRLAALATPGRAPNRQKRAPGAGAAPCALSRPVQPASAAHSQWRFRGDGARRRRLAAKTKEGGSMEGQRPNPKPRPRRNTRPPPRGKTAGFAFFPRWYCFGFKGYDFFV